MFFELIEWINSCRSLKMKIVNYFNLFLALKINGLNKFIKLLLKKDLIFKLNFEIIVMQIVIYFTICISGCGSYH